MYSGVMTSTALSQVSPFSWCWICVGQAHATGCWSLWFWPFSVPKLHLARHAYRNPSTFIDFQNTWRPQRPTQPQKTYDVFNCQVTSWTWLTWTCYQLRRGVTMPDIMDNHPHESQPGRPIVPTGSVAHAPSQRLCAFPVPLRFSHVFPTTSVGHCWHMETIPDDVQKQISPSTFVCAPLDLEASTLIDEGWLSAIVKDLETIPQYWHGMLKDFPGHPVLSKDPPLKSSVGCTLWSLKLCFGKLWFHPQNFDGFWIHVMLITTDGLSPCSQVMRLTWTVRPGCSYCGALTCALHALIHPVLDGQSVWFPLVAMCMRTAST